MRARFLLVLALLSACGEDASLSPLDRPKEEIGPKSDTTGGGTTAPPPRKREVFARNPFGGPPANLFADGDFELSTLPEGHTAQLGWRAFSASGASEVSIRAETGGICRTGLRCAVMYDEMIFLIRGAAAPHGAGHVASIWTRPPPGVACGDVAKIVLVSCDTLDALGLVQAVDGEPDASGWCEHGAKLEAQDSSICIYMESELSDDQIALVDSATLLADDGSASTPGEAWAPPPETADRMKAVGDRIRKSQRFGRPLGWDEEGYPQYPHHSPGLEPRFSPGVNWPPRT